MRVFFEKKHRKKHLRRPDKNYYYFRKSNDTTVINLIVSSRNMIKVSKNMSLYSADNLQKTDNFKQSFRFFETLSAKYNS